MTMLETFFVMSIFSLGIVPIQFARIEKISYTMAFLFTVIGDLIVFMLMFALYGMKCYFGL